MQILGILYSFLIALQVTNGRTTEIKRLLKLIPKRIPITIIVPIKYNRIDIRVEVVEDDMVEIGYHRRNLSNSIDLIK